MRVVNESLVVEDNKDGTVTVRIGSMGMTAPVEFFEDRTFEGELRLLVGNLRTAVALDGGDPDKPADLIRTAKARTFRLVR